MSGRRQRSGPRRGVRRQGPASVGGPPLEVLIEAVGAHGDGVAESSRGRLYVPLTAAGDRVRVQPLQRHGDGLLAELVEVLESGPGRAMPPCPHFGRCGGCSLQHLDEASYGAWKEQRLDRALARAGLVPDVRDPLLRVPPGSRRRATLSAVRTGAGAVLGFTVRRGHEVAGLTVCPVLEPRIVALMPELRRLLARLLSPGGRCDVTVALLDGDGEREGESGSCGGLDVVLEWPEPPGLPAREALAAFAAAADLARLSWRAGPEAPAEPLAQRRPVGARPGEVFVATPPAGFLQATRAGEAALIAAVREGVGAGVGGARTAADLYAGVGTFTLPLARDGVRVHAVDADEAALQALDAAARRARPPVTLPTTDRRDLAARPLADAELNRFEVVIFDPPRVGAAAQAEALARSRVPTVIAVSCNPDSFARDARILASGGYRLARVTPVDQFLWSAHLELAACFRR